MTNDIVPITPASRRRTGETAGTRNLAAERVQLNIKVSADTRRRLRVHTLETETPMNEIIEQLILDYLETHEA